MKMDRDEAVNWLTSQRNKEIGFQSFARFLKEQGNALEQLKIIHVAGTNGKGSVTAMLMSVLKEAGYKTGTFTSPHFLKHEDRIRINGQEIPEADFLRIFHQRKELWEAYHLSMFEMDLDLAAIWFCENQVDVVVLEAGMGGRNDSTNVIEHSLASVIVSIGLDHVDRLGSTVEEISFEKAGIIKDNGIVVCAEGKESCRQVICAEAQLHQAEVHQVKAYNVLSQSPIVFEYRGSTFQLQERALYQVHNASCAIEALAVLREKGLLEFSDEQLVKGIEKAHWPGRFDTVSHHPLTIVDGAHNAHGIKALKESVQVLPRPLTCVFACLKDKDKQEMIQMLEEISDHLILTEFDFYRAMKVADFKCAESTEKISDWKYAIEKARESTQTGTVLITGSLYFISEVMTYFKNQENNDDSCDGDSSAGSVSNQKTGMDGQSH